ncbi:MAG: PP2C family protein-serine/threonine phosphatase [Hormoscilla sp.]
MISELFKTIFSPSQYIPHGHCYLWQSPLVWLHALSDLLIAIAYFSIPAMLIYFIYRRRNVPFLGVFALFGAFIILCGLGHLLEIWTLWHPAYWLSGVEQAITAFVSCYTAGQMVTLLPQFLSLRTPEELEALNQELQTLNASLEHQVAKRTEELEALNHKLQIFNASLEHQVAERTAKLQIANQKISALNQRLKTENMRMTAELDIARQLHAMILPNPGELCQVNSLEIASFVETATEFGGDYYDVLYCDDLVKIAIGDVTGHGLESGVLMIMVQTAVRTLLEVKQTDHKLFLSALNRTIYKNIQRMNSDRNMTLCLLDYLDGTLYLTGQHEEAIVVRSNGTVEEIDTIDLGFPIGLEYDIAEFIAQTEIQLSAGDVVVLYTDGITEAEDINKQYYGMSRLVEVVRSYRERSAEAIKQAVIADLQQHIGAQKVYDDITLLILKQK